MVSALRVLNSKALFVALAATAFAPAALADSYTLLQLGSASSREQAEALAGDLTRDYAALISRYPLYIKEVQQLSTSALAWRVQAGPVETKARANRICAEIQAKGSDCFIIESAIPPSGSVKTAPNAAPGPVAATESGVSSSTETNAKNTPADTIYSGSIWPWNWGGSTQSAPQAEQPAASEPVQTALPQAPAKETPPAPPLAPASAKKLPWLQENEGAPAAPANTPSEQSGNVVVAEAIPVPLSEQQIAPAAPVASVRKRTTLVQSQRVPLNAWSHDRRSIHWLQIGLFANSEAALACWNTIQQRDTSLQNLQAQALQSGYIRSGYPKANLRIGPVESEESASFICGIAKHCGVRGLSCRGIAEIAGSGQTLHASPAARRPRYAPADYRSETPPSAAGSYWVHIGSAPSYAQARQAWQTMKSRYPDLFGDQQAVVGLPPSQGNNTARTSYRIRVGGFATREDASRLCASMTFRNLSCLVVAE